MNSVPIIVDGNRPVMHTIDASGILGRVTVLSPGEIRIATANDKTTEWRNDGRGGMPRTITEGGYPSYRKHPTVDNEVLNDFLPAQNQR